MYVTSVTYHDRDGCVFVCSVIGTPTALQWPLESSISPDQFEQHRPRVFSVLIPNAGPNTLELLSVRAKFQTVQ